MSIYVEVYKDDEKKYNSIADVPSHEKVTEYDESGKKYFGGFAYVYSHTSCLLSYIHVRVRWYICTLCLMC